jgi:hypothetical protein
MGADKLVTPAVALDVMREILEHGLGWTASQVDQAGLHNALDVVDTLAALYVFACPPVSPSSDEHHTFSSFSSFMEVFRYDCSPAIAARALSAGRVHCACPEVLMLPSRGVCVPRMSPNFSTQHRDTALLTIIPRFRGSVSGLEVFNWQTGAW